MNISRSSGVILPITSLPGRYGIGTLGKEAFEFIDLLGVAGQRYWQVPPVNPVSSRFDYSPYSAVSSFAGNPLLINLEIIEKEEWMMDDILSGLPLNNKKDHIDFREIISFKMPFLRKAFENFIKYSAEDVKNYFNYFCKDQKYWLDDYAFFASLAVHFDNFNWMKWDPEIAVRKPKALKVWREKLSSEIEFQKFIQFVFLKQWFALKKYASNKGIKLISEIPFHVNLYSSDVWSNQDIFELDKKTLYPVRVSGIPKNQSGSRAKKWGDPLYRWFEGKKLRESTMKWWLDRISNRLYFVDLIKLNHFVGFESSWGIPFAEKSADKGKWINGPGKKFFQRLFDKFKDLSLIADNLIFNSKAAEKIRGDYNIPCVHVLQYGFGPEKVDQLLPHHFVDSKVVLYSSSLDSSTTNGWFYGSEMDDDKRNDIMNYLGADSWDDFHWKFIRLAASSIACLTLFPVQDILGLGNESRLCVPTKPKGNWTWKLVPENLTPNIMLKLKKISTLYDRL
jgi:4-alpha-glucanotransferase